VIGQGIAIASRAGRDLGVTSFLHGNSGLATIVLFSLLTQLGDVWFLFLLSGLLYVSGETLPGLQIDRRRGLFVLALLLVYVGLGGVLKGIFLFPRPPGATEPPTFAALPAALDGLFTSLTTATGPGFPSGHAIGTTMVWGGLALVFEISSFRRRLAVVSAVVGVVCTARLVLGVHYLVDVLVGATLGTIALGLLYALSEEGQFPGRVLLVAVGVGLVGLVHGATFDSVSAIGGAVGGAVAWFGVADHVPAHPSKIEEAGASFAVVLAAGLVFGAAYTIEPGSVVTFVVTGLAVATAVGAPLLGGKLV